MLFNLVFLIFCAFGAIAAPLHRRATYYTSWEDPEALRKIYEILLDYTYVVIFSIYARLTPKPHLSSSKSHLNFPDHDEQKFRTMMDQAVRQLVLSSGFFEEKNLKPHEELDKFKEIINRL